MDYPSNRVIPQVVSWECVRGSIAEMIGDNILHGQVSVARHDSSRPN